MISWKWFKQLVDTKQIYPQYVEDDFYYNLKLYDANSLIEECQIDKRVELEDKEDFEVNYKALSNQPITQQKQVVSLDVPTTTTGMQKVSVFEPEGDSATVVTFNFADKCTWYLFAQQYIKEPLTTSDDLVFSKAGKTHWIDMTHGRVYDEDNLMGQNNNKWAVNIYVDGVKQTSGYTVNYEDGTVTFLASQAGKKVAADFCYATTSYYILRPRNGKILAIKGAEIQFSANIVLNTPFYFEPWFEDHPIYGSSPIPLSKIVYKNAKDFISAANEGQGVVPKWGELTQDVHVFPFNYARPKPMRYSHRVGIRIYTKDHVPVGGEFATGTFYVTMDTEIPVVIEPSPIGARMLTAAQMPAIITSDYTVQENDFFIRYDSSAGIINIQLPNPALGRRMLKFVDVRSGDFDSNGANLVPFAGEKIGGVAGTKNLPAQMGAGQTSLSVTSDLTDWWVDGITF